MTCFRAAIGLPESASIATNQRLLERMGHELTRSNLGVIDETTDLVSFYRQGVVVAASRSAEKAFVGARDEVPCSISRKRST